MNIKEIIKAGKDSGRIKQWNPKKMTRDKPDVVFKEVKKRSFKLFIVKFIFNESKRVFNVNALSPEEAYSKAFIDNKIDDSVLVASTVKEVKK